MAKTVNTAYPIAGETLDENEVGTVTGASRDYRVITAFNESSAVVLAATGLPVAGAAHPAFSSLRVTSRVPAMQSSGIEWIVTVKYELVPPFDIGDDYKLVKLEYGTHTIQQDILVNIATGDPILDANKKPFEGAIQEGIEFPFIKIIKQQKTVDRSVVLDKSGTINSAEVTVAGVDIPIHAGKIKITAVENPEADYPWEITYEVTVRYHDLKNFVDFSQQVDGVFTGVTEGPEEVGWDVGILNRGYYYYSPTGSGTGANRATENILDVTGNVVERRPTASPIPLNLDGTVMGEGETPISIRIQTIRATDWSDLGLDDV